MKKKNLILILLFIPLMFVSCLSYSPQREYELSKSIGGLRAKYYLSHLSGGSFNFKEENSEDVKIILKSTYVILSMHSFSPLAEAGVSFERVQHEVVDRTSMDVYFMHSYLYKKELLQVERVSVLIDDKEYTFRPIPKQSFTNTLRGNYREEHHTYLIPETFIQKIADVKASSVSIMLHGKKDSISLDYDSKHRTLMRQFIARARFVENERLYSAVNVVYQSPYTYVWLNK